VETVIHARVSISYLTLKLVMVAAAKYVNK